MVEQLGDSGYPGDGQPSVPAFNFQSLVRIFYYSLLFQASLSYVFFGLGVLFTPNSYHKHMLGLYGLFFGVVGLAYQFSYQPVVQKVHLFFPKLQEDLVRFIFYFLVGAPGITTSDSFQYQLGSIIFALIGFVGTLVTLRRNAAPTTYVYPEQDAYPHV